MGKRFVRGVSTFRGNAPPDNATASTPFGFRSAMRLTKQTNHAIRILVHCAGQRDQLLKVAEIAADLDITQQNVFKIVHLLTRAGFLKAMRGRHGGVRLAQPPAEIRIGDVVRATESTRMAIDEDEDAPSAQQPRQPISHVFDTALEAFISVLDQHTLEDMARSSRLVEVQKPPRRKEVGTKGRARATGVRQGVSGNR